MKWENEEQPTGVFLGGAETESLDLMRMPAAVRRLDRLSLPGTAPGLSDAARILSAVRAALDGFTVDSSPALFPLTGLDEAAAALLDDALGEGEVGIVVAGTSEYQIQESVLPGVWRVKTFALADGPAGALAGDHIEVADVPGVVRAAALGGTRARLEIGEPPEGCMNVMPVLAELRARTAAYAQGDRNHVISFTLFPMNETDMAFLKRTLGLGPVQAVSRGYGTCRVTLTGQRHVWSVQYLNAMDTVILDTLEIGDVPVALSAADEDFQDSAERLGEILEAYFQ
ncbi:hydrogenase expression/formation protein [Skermanella sp. TT6]|uniref:Hydrogenase expression/formation protein n=1 Tax=Skermanella cutis TaxID=2775420 RepID=A0ABX7BA46_9PROT|nr:hydrogenase expression/formation protein [Skermanella sp. TT6]QQP91047.1 hydrogenase expression/formation protein [Skermanella sp. TT6]